MGGDMRGVMGGGGLGERPGLRQERRERLVGAVVEKKRVAHVHLAQSFLDCGPALGEFRGCRAADG